MTQLLLLFLGSVLVGLPVGSHGDLNSWIAHQITSGTAPQNSLRLPPWIRGKIAFRITPRVGPWIAGLIVPRFARQFARRMARRISRRTPISLLIPTCVARWVAQWSARQIAGSISC